MSLEAGFRIGDREVYPLEGRIRGAQTELRIEPKAMAVLLDLVQHAGSVRTRDQIIQAVWPRGFVSDDVLTRCIGQLRRALEDDPRSPEVLETLPKRGYRLRGSVRALEPRAEPGERRVESLIVLPFLNLSASAEDFIADGVTELLIARLAALSGLRVISRTTAMQFKGSTAGIAEIAARTKADWLIEGSVLQSGERIQVVVQLIDTRTDAHVWAADYLRELQDILVLQNEIVSRVAAAIRLELGAADSPLPAPAPLTPQAMRDYLKGRYFVSRRTLQDLEAARALFAAVTDAAPYYASGWASLAESEMLLAHYGADDAGLRVAGSEAHVERALTLDPDLAIGLSTRGALRFFYRRELTAAAADLARALHLLPSYALCMLSMANVCAVRRDFAEANAWMEQALLVDPLDVGINMNVGDHMVLQRRYGAAVTALNRALELSPQHRPSALRLCWALALEGSHAAAGTRLVELRPAGEADAPWHEYAALLAGARGDRPAALDHYRALSRLQASQPVSPWSLARAAAAAGEIDVALGLLEAAARQRLSSVPFMMVTPAFDSLRPDPRFQSLGASLGLPG